MEWNTTLLPHLRESLYLYLRVNISNNEFPEKLYKLNGDHDEIY